MKKTTNPGEQQSQQIPRRKFIQTAGIAAAGVTIVPRHVLGGVGFQAPSDTMNVAGVGVGGMGRSNMTALASQNIVALCDVDWDYAGKGFDNLATQAATAQKRLADAAPEMRARMEANIASQKLLSEKAAKAKRYVDYREMLEKQKDIDGIVVATPDHTHAVIAMAAMDLGKHVYVQKPLCWSVFEARELAKKAKEKKIVSQMGNQGHSSDDARTVNEYIWSGAIGEVREVHAWTNRPLGYWPQGIPRPAATTGASAGSATGTGVAQQPGTPERWNMEGVTQRLVTALGHYPKPDKLAWDLFLGPGPMIEYHPIYHPFNWRGWVDWGQGALGDMGAHLLDHAFWALNLGYPTSVETISTPFNKASYPAATTTYYEFAARENMPAVKLTWYDGGLVPPKPEELGDERVDPAGGVLYIGSKGKLVHETYGNKPRLLPKSAHESFGKPPEKLPRVKTSHEMNWVEAIKGKAEATSPFEYASRLTEVMLLGIVSLRAGGKIQYDATNMRVTNLPAANEFLRREYRQGWSL
jgi:predicted dehydrogenase